MIATVDQMYYDAGTTADIGDYELTYAVSGDYYDPMPDDESVTPGCYPFRRVLNLNYLNRQSNVMSVRYPVGFV